MVLFSPDGWNNSETVPDSWIGGMDLRLRGLGVGLFFFCMDTCCVSVAGTESQFPSDMYISVINVSMLAINAIGLKKIRIIYMCMLHNYIQENIKMLKDVRMAVLIS